jgi:hypothetical protein
LVAIGMTRDVCGLVAQEVGFDARICPRAPQ